MAYECKISFQEVIFPSSDDSLAPSVDIPIPVSCPTTLTASVKISLKAAVYDSSGFCSSESSPCLSLSTSLEKPTVVIFPCNSNALKNQTSTQNKRNVGLHQIVTREVPQA